MEVSSILTDIYNSIIRINDIDIIFIFDNENNIWFSYNDTLESIGYKKIKQQKWRLKLDDKFFDTYENIYKKSTKNIKPEKTIQPHTKMINESGLYFLLTKSNKKLAQKVLEKMVTDILPTIRKNGGYNIQTSEKKQIKKLTQKLRLRSKEQFIHSKTKKKYANESGNGFIYVLKIKTTQNGSNKTCYKIGYTADLNKRLATYKTGNPDVELAYSENLKCDKKQLEKCILSLNTLKLLKNRTEVICNTSLKEIKEEINDCKKLLKKHS